MLCTGPFTRPLLVETVISRLWLSARLQTTKSVFRIVVGIDCRNVPILSPQSGWHGVIEVAKTSNIPKMAEKYIKCISTRPTLPHTNPMELGFGTGFTN